MRFIFAALVLALLVACGGSGGGSTSTGGVTTINAVSPVPSQGNYTFGQAVTLTWALGGGTPDSITLEVEGQPGVALASTATSASFVLSSPLTVDVLAQNTHGTTKASWDFTILPSTTTLVSSANPAADGEAVTFTATVTAGAVGPISFKDGTTLIGWVELNENSVASFTTSSLVAGSHSITADFPGSGNFQVSASPALAQVVTP